MSTHRPHFPITTPTYNGSLIAAAAQKYPKVAARLPANYLADTTALITKVTADITGQKNAKGATGTLTKAQQANLDTLLHCMNQARQTAKLAFAGQTVKLHQEFQIGAHDKNDLASFLSRCDTVLGSVQNAANLPTLKQKGWTDAETTAFQTARNAFGPAETYRAGHLAGVFYFKLRRADTVDRRPQVGADGP